MILDRICSFINPLLRPNQNGFRKGLHLITNTYNSEDNRRHQRKESTSNDKFYRFLQDIQHH